MSEPVRTPPEDAPAAAAPVVVKKYANRRLYNTESSSYITLDTLAEMIRNGRDFVVYDAKSGEDITRSVLTQIIVEEEGKGTAMLPTSFLRQLIGFYGDNLQALVPRYLEQAMGAFALQQKQMREAMRETVGRMFPFTGMEEVSRQNIAMIERTMTMWSQLYRPPAAEAGQPGEPDPQLQELALLRAEIESLRAQLAKTETPSDPAQPGGATEQSANSAPPTEVNTKT